LRKGGVDSKVEPQVSIVGKYKEFKGQDDGFGGYWIAALPLITFRTTTSQLQIMSSNEDEKKKIQKKYRRNSVQGNTPAKPRKDQNW